MNPSLSQEKMIKNSFVSHLKTGLVQIFFQIPLGDYFKKRLIKIQIKFPNFISKISGKGLFIGIDLIVNGNLSLPNQKLATKLINALRLISILLSTDGPYNNVIKIKPPLVFNKHNVDFVCSEIEKFLIHEDKK